MTYCRYVFVRLGDGEIFRISPGEGQFAAPCINPDGTDAVCHGYVDGSLGLWRLPLTSEAPERLSARGEAALMPSYSWDGRAITYSSDGGGGNGPKTMAEFLAWPPPARTALNIFVMDPATGDSKRITDGSWHDYRPTFSPDGSRIVFASDRGGRMQLWTVDTGGRGEPQRIQETGWGMRPWCSVDGESVYFHTDVDGWHRICRIDVRSGEFEPMPNDDRGMSHGAFVLPAGDALLMHSSRDGGSGIYRLPLDGSEPERVETPGFAIAGHATQTADGVMTFDSTESPQDVELL